MTTDYKPDVWIGDNQKPIGCSEKIQLLNNSLEEIKKLCSEMIEDAVVMGCSEEYVRTVLLKTVSSLDKPFSSYETNV